ncbi:MAG: diacylglycerol/lipid kinase family protein [Candidatus Coproplasma sp.]
MFHIIVHNLYNDLKKIKQLETVKSVFENAGKGVELHMTDHPSHATEIARELTAGGRYADIIAMGGDGTLHEVINGIVDVENCTLGLIPMGTGNDFASTIKVPKNPISAAKKIITNTPTPIDYIELSNGLRSINAVGTGIDVDVLKYAYASKSKRRNKYFSALFKALRHFQYTKFKVSWDGGEERAYNGMIAALGNGASFGGGIKMFPTAKIDDGYMDLVVVDYVSRMRMVIAFIKLVLGKAHKIKEATYVKCKSAKFIPENQIPTIQAEGELYDNVPLEAHIVAGKLKFYLP